ncbi:MAG: flagellar hook-basal body complex protein FliE [Pseudochelatococcus sp.]|uniref:flagellar hook-basal body complex protein FliE n=1 Tax=Pseudochelatococcus sp. TaxID=2020869 RepID=UPI003D93B1D7
MAINAIDASAASGAARGVTGLAQAGSAGPAAAGGADFASVLGSLVTDTTTSLRASEAAAIAGIERRLPTHTVVEAIMAAERSLQTTLAVRDKVVSAYQEISRMAI